MKDGNALGEALGRLLPWLSAASAATFQQGLVSAIAELLIAAGLALPELLRRELSTARPKEVVDGVDEDEKTAARAVAETAVRRLSIAGVPLSEPPKPEQTPTVAQFMLACLPRVQGQDVALAAVYARYRRWCEDQTPAVAAEDAGSFADQFKPLSDRVRLRTERRGHQIIVRDVQLVA